MSLPKLREYGRPKVRFWRRVNKLGPIHPTLGRCWQWTGGTINGYGNLWVLTENRRAHRFSWEIHFGPVESGMNVLHRCDNPSCVNPNHLFLGTHADNIEDMVSKERHPRGETNGRSKLTEEDVLKIRRMYQWRSAEFGSFGLAAKFGVSQAVIMSIIKNKRWTHVRA